LVLGSVTFSHTLVAGVGDRRWVFTTGGEVDSSPAVNTYYVLQPGPGGGLLTPVTVIYVGSSDGKLYALNTDGSMRWSYATGGAITATPAIGPDGTIYVGSWDKRMYAITDQGTLRWRKQTAGEIRSSAGIGPDGSIYFGTSAGEVYILAADGAQTGYYSVVGPVDSSPAIGPDGTSYFTHGTTLRAWSPRGEDRWQFHLGDSATGSPAIGLDGAIYAAAANKLYAVRADGTLKWIHEGPSEFSSSPSVGTDGTVYIGAGVKLAAVRLDGSADWRREVVGTVRSTPAVGSDGTIYFGTDNRDFYALNPDGTVAWRYSTTGSVRSSPLILGQEFMISGVVYVGSTDGKLYAIECLSGGAAQSCWPAFRGNSRRTGLYDRLMGLPTLLFTQLADGAGYRAEVMITNTGKETETGAIYFKDPQGRPMTLGVAAQQRTALDFSLAPGAVFRFRTDGTDPLKIGTVWVNSLLLDSHLSGSLAYDLRGFEVSVPSSPVSQRYHVFAEKGSAVNTGVALVNPTRSALKVKLELVAGDGVSFTSKDLVLNPGEHSAKFIDEIFANVPNPFVGSLQAASEGHFALLGLRLRSNGSLTSLNSSPTAVYWLAP
jgi:outer membrane protein assembly factor BamB